MQRPHLQLMALLLIFPEPSHSQLQWRSQASYSSSQSRHFASPSTSPFSAISGPSQTQVLSGYFSRRAREAAQALRIGARVEGAGSTGGMSKGGGYIQGEESLVGRRGSLIDASSRAAQSLQDGARRVRALAPRRCPGGAQVVPGR